LAARDRVVWTWPRPTTGASVLYRITGALSAPFAGRTGRWRVLAKRRVPYPRVLTNARGGQVAAWNDGKRFRVMARRPGRRFGRVRSRPSDDSSGGVDDGAINDAGDAVFAWSEYDDEVYAAVRRRGGRIVGPQHISKGDEPVFAGNPSVAIDGRGRAIVAWEASDDELWKSSPREIRIAIAGRRGRFGGARVVSGSRRRLDSSPHVAVNARGRAAVAWTRRRGPTQDDPFQTWLVRGRLGR
jgi:hypothetical protein